MPARTDYDRFLHDVKVLLVIPDLRHSHPLELSIFGPEQAAAVLERALTQTAKGHGATPEDPLRNLGVEGFYCMIHALACEVTYQAVRPVAAGAMLDIMTVRGSDLKGVYELTLFNLVEDD